MKTVCTPWVLIACVGGGRAALGGGNTCIYDNYFPLDDLGAPASQRDTVYPFFAEAADDFTLLGQPGTTCTLHTVTVGVTFSFGNATPIECWDGVKITIYEDAASFCGGGFDPGPAGHPVDLPGGDRDHVELCPGGVVCELTVPITLVRFAETSSECIGTRNNFAILICGLEELQCELASNHLYWIAVAPVQQAAECGQTFSQLSHNNGGLQAQQYFTLFQRDWHNVIGNLGHCPPDTPPTHSRNNLAIRIAAFGEEGGIADLNGDGIVGPSDLNIVLGQWGHCPPPSNPCSADLNCDASVDPADLAIVLGNWG